MRTIVSLLKNKKFLIGLFLLVVLIVLLVGKLSADNQARKLNVEAENQGKEAVAIKQLTDNLAIEPKMIVGRTETQAELDAIKTECSKLNRIEQNAKSLSANYKLAANPFGFLSSEYKTAREKIAKLPTTNEIVSETEKLRQGCRVYVASVQAVIDNDKNSEARDKLLTTNNCTFAETCLPRENAAEFKKLYQETLTELQVLAKLSEGKCEYAESQKLCDIYGAYVKKKVPVRQAYLDALPDGDYSAAADTDIAVEYPEDEICAEARKIAPDANIQDECYTRAFKFVTAAHEDRLRQNVNKLVEALAK